MKIVLDISMEKQGLSPLPRWWFWTWEHKEITFISSKRHYDVSMRELVSWGPERRLRRPLSQRLT